jgi:hypothetical protein
MLKRGLERMISPIVADSREIRSSRTMVDKKGWLVPGGALGP